MEDAAAVDEAETLEELLHEGLEVRGGEVDRGVVEDTGEVVVDVLEDHVDMACAATTRKMISFAPARNEGRRMKERQVEAHLWRRASLPTRPHSDASSPAAT